MKENTTADVHDEYEIIAVLHNLAQQIRMNMIRLDT
jgi:hypothetical protein